MIDKLKQDKGKRQRMKFTRTITGNKRIKTLLESRKTEIFLVAVILLAAIFVRAYHFGARPSACTRTKLWRRWMPRRWRNTEQTVTVCGIRYILQRGRIAR